MTDKEHKENIERAIGALNSAMRIARADGLIVQTHNNQYDSRHKDIFLRCVSYIERVSMWRPV